MTAAAETDPPAVTGKQDPEALVLRAKPRPVVRFRRGVIIAAVVVAALSLFAIAWLALRPVGLRIAASDEAGMWPRSKTPDALAAAPAGYGDVPRLGPPLPGDLGRPILAHQRALGHPSDEPGVGGTDTGLAAAEAERGKRETEAQAARESAVLVSLAKRSAPGAPGQVDGGIPPASERVSGTNPDRAELREPPSRWMLSAGTIIPASLITGLNSALPGPVLAQVTEPLRDSVAGQAVLIPQGARLLGRYDRRVSFGERRAMVVWQRILFPDGSSIDLDDLPASDAAGFTGLEDRVDSHGWQLLKGVVLSTLLGVGTELSLGSSESELVEAVRDSTQQNAASAGDKLVSRQLDVQPTITVRPGWPVRAILTRDLVLRPWREHD